MPALSAILPRLRAEFRGYGPPYNRADLIGLAGAAFRADGLPAAPIALVSGALDGVERVLMANLRAGDRVAVEDPGYPPIFDLLGALGLRPEPCALDDSGIIPDELTRVLKSQVAALIITPRAQNPTGAAFDATRAARLRRIIRDVTDLMVIEDDHAGPIAGVPPLTLCDAARTRWAIVRSMSKAFGPDLRVALVTGDAMTIGRLEGRQRLGPGSISHVLQEAAATILADPATPALVARAAVIYAERRAALIDALARHGIAAHARSGLNVWVPVPEELSVTQSMLDAGWAISAGARYRLRSGPAIRISIATLRPAEAERLAADLARSLATDRRGHYA